MSIIDSIAYIVILIFSVGLHEVSHGYAALSQGDDTARKAGRLTLNPIAHIDLLGSIIIPAVLILSQVGIVFGWAKPVPYDDRNFVNKKKGILIVAVAGILANLTLALIFAATIRIALAFNIGGASFIHIASLVVITNIILAFFNLIPIPPLDGSKILFSLLPARYESFSFTLERYAFPFLLIFIIFVWQYFSPLIYWSFHLLTNVSL